IQGSAELAAQCHDVELPLDAALAAFMACGLPGTLTDARSMYPQLDALSPARRTALASLVYNRGTRLTDNDPARAERLEMRAIKRLLAEGNHDAVAEQFDSMARLWNPQTQGGLVARSHRET